MSKDINVVPSEISDFLCEVTQKEILEKRASGEPGIVVKIGDQMYQLSEEGMQLFRRDFFGEHRCANCKKLSGAKCSKVWDLSKEAERQNGVRGMNSIISSKRIEKYEFITRGVELFNAEREILVVLECDNFELDPPRKATGGEAEDPAMRRYTQVGWLGAGSIYDRGTVTWRSFR